MQKNMNICRTSLNFWLISLIGFLMISQIMFSLSTAREENPPGNTYQGGQIPQEGPVEYHFINNVDLQFNVTQNITLNVNIDPEIMDRYIGIDLQNEEPINVNFYGLKSFEKSPGAQMGRYRYGPPNTRNLLINNYNPSVEVSSERAYGRDDDEVLYSIEYNYNTYYQLEFDGLVDSLTVSTILDENSGLTNDQADYSWAIYDKTSEEWYLLDSTSADGVLKTTLDDSVNIGTEIALTVVEISSLTTSTFWDSYGIYIIVIGSFGLAFGLIMSKQEYRSYLLNRFMPINKGPHRLTMEQVLENENRTKIINLIIDDPGIHFNELLREVQISAGTLAWHLDILETFRVIRKQRVGQYLIYYPYLDKNPISKLDFQLQKSRTTMEILQLVNDHPGMFQNQIAKRMDLDHKTVKYHLDKLIEADIIYSKKQGRTRLFFPKDLREE